VGFFVCGMMGRFRIVPKKILEDYSLEKITRLISALMGKSFTLNRINKGITNNNFKVIVDGKAFFISIPGTNSKLLNIDFKNKYYNNKICGDIGISPKVVHYIKAEELLVTEFITSKNSVSKSFHGSEKISVLVKMIKTLHDAKPFYRNFNMFTYIYHYMNILKKEGLPKLLFPISNRIDNLGQKLALYRRHLVPCHNDFVIGNIIDNQNQMFLVDFDYSGNNDPCFELGNLIVEMNYNHNQVNELIKRYYGEIQENIISRVYLQGIASDIGWSLWGYVQAKVSNLNYDFNQYAINRMERVMNKMDSADYELWLKNI
jgi:thiamine kinase-like enzyme